MALTLRMIEIISAVSRCKSLSQAAERLYISEPALSKQLRRIEEELGVQVIERNFSGCRLTEAGKIIAQDGIELLQKRDDLQAKIRQAASKLRPIRFGVSDCYMNVFLPDLLSSYARHFPGMEISLSENRTDVIEQLCVSGSLDLIPTQTVPTNPDLSYIPLCEEETVIYLSIRGPQLDELKAHMKNGRLNLRMLQDYPYCKQKNQPRYSSFVDQFFMESGWNPTPSFSSSSSNTILRFLQNHEGYSLLPKIYDVDPAEIQTFAIDTRLPVRRTLSLAYRKGLKTLPEEWTGFIELAQKFFRQKELTSG